MALQLLKLLVTSAISTSTVPTNNRFFHVTTGITLPGASLTINTGNFFQDNGLVATLLPTLSTNNSYYNVCINGILQMGGNSTYTPGGVGVGKLVFTVPVGGNSILAGTSIVLEVINYGPVSTATVTT